MPEIIVNRAALDYLTVTTFDRPLYSDILKTILTRDEREESEKDSIKRYVGMRSVWTCGSVFYGEGLQDGFAHWIISASGGAADRVGYALSGQILPSMNVTRIDVQITIEKPSWYRARDFVDAVEEGEWKGRRRKPVLIENGGDDTVYLGSYHSDRFTRIYVKEKTWLRLETVFKRDYAEEAWKRYAAAPAIAPAGLLVSELIRFPKHPIIDAFAAELKNANQIDVQKAKPVKTLSTTYLWLVRSVAPAVSRLLNDHESGEMTKQLLRDWIGETDQNED